MKFVFVRYLDDVSRWLEKRWNPFVLWDMKRTFTVRSLRVYLNCELTRVKPFPFSPSPALGHLLPMHTVNTGLLANFQ